MRWHIAAGELTRQNTYLSTRMRLELAGGVSEPFARAFLTVDHHYTLELKTSCLCKVVIFLTRI